MKNTFKCYTLLALTFLLAGCSGGKELRRLETSYKVQLEEYAEQYKDGKITKVQHDKKVTLLNSRYGNRRAQMEREIYGDSLDRNRPAPMINQNAATRSRY